MRSRNELNRVDSPSSSGPARPRTRRDSARYAGEPGVELIDLPPYATAPSPQASQLERRSTESTSRRKGLLARLWDEQISIVVDRETSRDHFALERTFLGYMRTSSFLALTGVLVAQLTILQQRDSGFGYSLVGRPMATCCYASAIWITLFGACRVWRYQRALIRGHALSGGFELTSITVLLLMLLAVFLGFTIAIDTPWHPSRAA